MMNIAIKSLWYFFSACLALSLMVGCTTSSTAPPVANGEEQLTCQLEINFIGTKNVFLADSQGKLSTKVTLASADDRVTLSIGEGTAVLDKEGGPLKVLHAAIDPNPPPPPEDAYIVGTVYNFEPEGANFNPQIKLTLSYNLEELPEGVKEKDIYIACYEDAKWDTLRYAQVDVEKHKVTTQIDHFTRFAILAPREQSTSVTPPVPADRVKVVYFHRAQRCSGCIYAETVTRYTLETYFKDELDNGKLTFEVYNVKDEKNATIVKKYDAFTSSLFINTIRDGTDHIEEVKDIWFILGKDEEFVKVVKSNIENSLQEIR